MSQDYKIIAVANRTKDWSSTYGNFTTYSVQVQGNGEPVAINKKADSEPPKEGDVIYGDITDSEFGQKFKSAKKPFGQQGYQESPEKQASINRAVALNNAVNHLAAQGQVGLADKAVLDWADKFLAWLQAKPEQKDTSQPEKPVTEAVDKPRGKTIDELSEEESLRQQAMGAFDE